MLVDVPEIILVENNFHHLQQSDSFSGGVFSISDDKPFTLNYYRNKMY